MSLNTTLSVRFTGTVSNPHDLETPTQQISYAPSYVFTDRGGQNKASTLFSDTRTLTALVSETITMLGGTNQFGVTYVNKAIKVLAIRSHPGNLGDLQVGPNTTSGWLGPFNRSTCRLIIRPSGLALFVAPSAEGFFVNANEYQLFVQNMHASAAATYSIIMVGAE